MKTNWALIAITATFTFVLSINPLSYAFHEKLGIDDNKASELYHTNPNDPAIVLWKYTLQLSISGMDKCFDIKEAISCQFLIPTIISNCKSHPNTLIACNDSRLPQYPLILQQAREKAEEAQKKTEEAQKKTEEAQKKTEELQMREQETRASLIIDRCMNNSTASPSCDDELLSLRNDCELASTPYNYCKDEGFVGYLNNSGIVNPLSPYGDLTGNSSSSNSTYP